MILKTSLMCYPGTQHMFQSPHIHGHIDSIHLSRDIHWLLASYRLTKNKKKYGKYNDLFNLKMN